MHTYVPDTGHLRQAFPRSLLEFFERAPVVVVHRSIPLSSVSTIRRQVHKVRVILAANIANYNTCICRMSRTRTKSRGRLTHARYSTAGLEYIKT